MPQLRPPFAGLLLAALLSGLLLPACGGQRPSGPPAWGGPGAWMTSKPLPSVGRVEARIRERPSADRAWIEARWENAVAGSACALELVLPEGALLVQGSQRAALPDDARSGASAWLVEFPVGVDLDAVVRFCAEGPAGLRAADVAVRLGSPPDSPD